MNSGLEITAQPIGTMLNMLDDRPEYSWYALRVKSNYERIASTALKGSGYVEFAPFYRSRRRWSDRVKETEAPLFPGYVFARFDPNNRLPILTAPGVVEVISFAKRPVPVPDDEIEAVSRILATSTSCGPWPFMQTGQHVLIEHGPLAGLEGILLEQKARFRLIVSVSILQRSVSVEVDRDWVRPIGSRKKPVGSGAAVPREITA